MDLYNDISTETLIILGIIAFGLFFIVVRVIFRDSKYLEQAEEKHDRRVNQLRLGKMLGKLNIPLKKYDHHTTDLEQELHIWHCEHCPHPDKCERMFAGEDIDPKTFCPNYEELIKLKKKL